MAWWPIDTGEARGALCDKCKSGIGLSRDDEGKVYCSTHRHLHS